MLQDATRNWSTADATELYEVERWGKGYFSIGPSGDLLVHPTKETSRSINMKQLIDRLQLRGIQLPILVRFNGILQNRLKEIHDAFQRSIDEYQYKGRYSCVYPIKVNQQRQVVERIVEYGREFGFGLEAGSKPELLAVVALTDEKTPIVCNG
ncbi:MAG: hypothetical protein KDA55_01905, partial [Planctomycetales bacterium]|nr:hypothetical protein [Planctomycetales bacterium]